VGWCRERLDPLSGFTIAVTADRRREEQADLLQRRGASVTFAPAIRIAPSADGETIAATRRLIAEPPNYLLATTGIGMRMWFSVAEAAGLEADLRIALAHTRVVARGPKSGGALYQLAFPPWLSEPTERIGGVVDRLLDLGIGDATIAVQLYGSRVPAALDRLEARGARIVPVPVYGWDPPADARALTALVRDVALGRVAAVTFTSAPAVESFFDAAAVAGLDDRARGAFNRSAVAVAVGPVTAEAVAAHGVHQPCFPDPGRLGLMVRALSNRLQTQHRHLSTDGHRPGDVAWQGACIADRSRTTELTPREHHVFTLLATRPRRVVTRALLRREVWGREQVDPSAVDSVVRRLRRRVKPFGLEIKFVQGRGFALAADAARCPSA
jgi:uroporphyrinogen-III synthase